MARPGPVQDRSKETKALLLEAAYRVFVREGFEGAQIDAIASEAGRTKGAVYAHFENKEHLFISLMEHRTRETAKRIDVLVAGCTTRDQFVAVFHAAITDLPDPDWAILNLELKLFAIRHPATAKRLKQTFRKIHQHAASAVAERLQGETMVAIKLAALWTIVSAVVLDLKFDAKFMSKQQARILLSEVLDGIFPNLGKSIAS